MKEKETTEVIQEEQEEISATQFLKDLSKKLTDEEVLTLFSIISAIAQDMNQNIATSILEKIFTNEDDKYKIGEIVETIIGNQESILYNTLVFSVLGKSKE